MHCVCPNISSLPLTFVLACIQDRKQRIQHTNKENSTEKDRILKFFFIFLGGGREWGLTGKQEMSFFLAWYNPSGELRCAKKKRPSVSLKYY